MVLEAGIRAVQQAGRHRQAVVGGGQPFVEHGFEHRGQALAAVFWRGRQRRPAAIDEGLVRLAKAWRRNDLAVGKAASDFVAATVDRGHHFADEAARFFEHLRLQRLVDFCKGRERGQARGRIEHGIEQKTNVFGAGLIVHRGAEI